MAAALSACNSRLSTEGRQRLSGYSTRYGRRCSHHSRKPQPWTPLRRTSTPSSGCITRPSLCTSGLSSIVSQTTVNSSPVLTYLPCLIDHDYDRTLAPSVPAWKCAVAVNCAATRLEIGTIAAAPSQIDEHIRSVSGLLIMLAAHEWPLSLSADVAYGSGAGNPPARLVGSYAPQT